ncbi:MAG TPA: hypothetical protein DCW46_06890 [Desulfotomaculum sp.]|nr:hypothetical protein [Desulfotomaculum sp.]HAU31972.1 hypothetical protein [Desulfotomaculum sp.]
MLKEGKIGVFEATAIVVVASLTKVMFSGPRADVEILGPAVWYVYIVTTLLALAGFLIISKLMEKFPGQDLVFVFKKVFGNVAGCILSFLVGIAFFIGSIVFLRLFTEAVKAYVYTFTPPSFIMVFFISAVLVVLYLGLETIARTAAIFILPILFGLLLTYILGFPSSCFQYLDSALAEM